MYPYDEYKFSHHRGIGHFRAAQALGLLPLLIATVLLLSRGTAAGPGLWSAIGSALAFEMILWSAKSLYEDPRGRTRWGERFVQKIDTYLPPLLVVAHGVFIAVTLCLFWFSLVELGLPTNGFQLALFLMILVVPPVRRLLHVDDAFAARPRTIVANQFLVCAQVVLITLLITTSVQYLIFPKDNNYITEVPLPAVVVWVPAILICAGCVVFFVDSMRRR